MAITIKPISRQSIKGPLRGQHAKAVMITPDASKPAAGYTILATDIGLSFMDFGVVGYPSANALGYHAKFTIGTASTDATLQYFQLTCSATNAATDIGTGLGASVTAITTNPVVLYVVGR